MPLQGGLTEVSNNGLGSKILLVELVASQEGSKIRKLRRLETPGEEWRSWHFPPFSFNSTFSRSRLLKPYERLNSRRSLTLSPCLNPTRSFIRQMFPILKFHWALGWHKQEWAQVYPQRGLRRNMLTTKVASRKTSQWSKVGKNSPKTHHTVGCSSI